MCFAFSNVVLNVSLHCVVSYLIAFHIFKYFIFNYDFAFKCRLVLNCITSYLCLNSNIVSCSNYLCHVVLYLLFRIFIYRILLIMLFSYFFIYFYRIFIIVSFYYFCILFIMFFFVFLFIVFFLLLLGSKPIFWLKFQPNLAQNEAQTAAR